MRSLWTILQTIFVTLLFLGSGGLSIPLEAQDSRGFFPAVEDDCETTALGAFFTNNLSRFLLLKVGSLEITNRGMVYWNDRPVPLNSTLDPDRPNSPILMRLLIALADFPDITRSRDELRDDVWPDYDEDHDGNGINNIYAGIRNIRLAFESVDENFGALVTNRRGAGYVWFTEDNSYFLHGVEVNKGLNKLTYLGQEVKLARIMFYVTLELLESSPDPVSRRKLYEVIEEHSPTPGKSEAQLDDLLNAYIRKIRQAFVKIHPNFSGIIRVPSLGYRWDPIGVPLEPPPQ